MNAAPAYWLDESIDWISMTEPPTFHTRVVGHDGEREEDDDKREKAPPPDPRIVVTMAEDFPSIGAGWATASDAARATWFWAVGLVHVAEVELMRFRPELYAEAATKLGKVRNDDPRAAAAQIAKVVREVRAEHPEFKFRERPPLLRADLSTFQRLLAVRASGPYSGPGPEAGVRFVCLARGQV